MESAKNREQSSKVNQQDINNDSPTLSKIETIKLLNESIDQLESTIKDISKNSTQKLPSSDSINTLLSTTQELADSVATPASTPIPPNSTPSPAPVVEETPSGSPTPVAATQPIEVQEVQPTPATKPPAKKPPVTPNTVKPKNKTVGKNQKKENRGLTIIGIIAVAIALVAVVWLWLPAQKTTLSDLPEPTTTEITQSEPTLKPDVPTMEQPVLAVEDNPEQPLESEPLDPELSDREVESPVAISIPQELVAPGKIANLKIETIEPELTFTPEQTLVAALQTKLAELTSNYDPDLFNSVLVNLPDSSLIIEVTNDWYELKESRQNKFANEILERSRKFDFRKLQFFDPTGTLVARNPVVGDRIILLQNSTE